MSSPSRPVQHPRSPFPGQLRTSGDGCYEKVSRGGLLVSQTAQDAATELATLIKDDKLLTSRQMSRPHRLAAAANLVPFLSQQAVLRAFAITNPEGTDLKSALRMMIDYVARWSTSTIDGAASAWFRLHWLATELNIVPDIMFDGPVLVTLFRCVAEHASQKASRAVAGGAIARGNGTTAETQVRNGLFSVTRN
jgi:hypothetical protein